MWKFIINLLAAGLVMKRNMDWHRKIIFITVPFYILFMLAQTEYIIYRVKQE